MGVIVDMQGVKDAMQQTLDGLSASVPAFLASVGQRFVEVARDTKTYQDRTGNLTSSIGFGVFHNGTMVDYGGFGVGEGANEGLQALEEAGSEANVGYSLVVVAGMHYATYVERSGFAVLDGARVRADEIVNQLIGELSK